MTDNTDPAISAPSPDAWMRVASERQTAWRVLSAAAVLLATVGLVVAVLLWQRLNLACDLSNLQEDEWSVGFV
jgi:hypothetical protein